MVRIVAFISGAMLALVVVFAAMRLPAVSRAVAAPVRGDSPSTAVFLPTIKSVRPVTPTPVPTGEARHTATPIQPPTGTPGTPVRTPTRTPTSTATNASASTPVSTPDSTPANTPAKTPASTATSTATSTPTESVTVVPKESFEGAPGQWLVSSQTAGGGSVTQSDAQAASGSLSARASIAGAGGSAILYQSFNDRANDHMWFERPGTWHWQGARLYLPSAVADQLSGDESLTLGGIWPSGSASGFGWSFQVRQGNELWVDGYDSDGEHEQFDIYGTFPTDKWVSVELGLHSQAGRGVKRAFALVIDGNFYGWFHQGRMESETYDRAAFGLLGSTADGSAEVFVDDWFPSGSGQFPVGPDHRSRDALQELDYRRQSGVGWQIDWSTWGDDLVLDPAAGLYSATRRLQSGMNIERMPDLSDGWGEIEFGWSQGQPPLKPDGPFTAMIGFRKEINREENLEVVFDGDGTGAVDMWLDAWVDNGPVIQAKWPMPEASIGGTHITEPGDILRAWWNTAPGNSLHVRVRYYDASADKWYDAIDHTFSMSITNDYTGYTADFNDGYHTAASITIDSPFYSIRRFKVGTPDTAPAN